MISRCVTFYTIITLLLQDVVQTLVKHGRQTFQEIRYLSKLPTDALRTALVVLIQQNCVAVYLHTNDHDRKTEQLYEADLPRMLQIMRMPRFIEHVRTEFGEQPEWGETCISVVQSLLHHGRLRLAQLPHAVRSMRAAAGEEEVDVPARTMLNAVKALINARLVERVPPCTLPPPAMQTHERYRKRRAAAPKAGSEEDQQLRKEAERTKQRMDFQSVRFDMRNEATLEAFTLPPAPEQGPQGGDGDGFEDDAAGGKRKRPPAAAAASAPAPKKGKVEVKREDGSIQIEEAKPVVLWRVNYEEFNRRLRNEQIVNLVAAQFKTPSVTAVAEALLSAAAPKESHDVRERMSGWVNCDEIAKESRRLHGDSAVPRDAVPQSLNELVNVEFVDRSGVDRDRLQYSFDLHFCLGVVRQGQILTVVGQRFGETAKRIWYMLKLENQLEQKAVAEKAMVPNADAREALYAMLKDGYLGLQDIPRNNDRAPSKTFYTWRASVAAASSRLATELYRSAGNVLARLSAETLANTNLLEMVDLVTQGRMEQSQLDARALTRFKNVARTLETALVRLDLQMALFNDM